MSFAPDGWDPKYVKDPGPPTYGEGPGGCDFEMRKIADALKMARWRASEGSQLARGEEIKLGHEWRHWANQKRRAEAFLRVHPELANVSIRIKCRHWVEAWGRPACWTGDDDGYYREPGTRERPWRTERDEREPGSEG